MQNIHDRAKLSEAEELAFIESCKDEFIEKSLAATNAKQVKTLTTVSFLPNVISAVTAGFFVLYLLQSYPRTIAALLGAVLFVVVLAVEVGKRALIGGISKTYFVAKRVAILGIIALAVLISISMGASYMGGKALIVETATPPPREENPEVAAIQAQLSSQQETIRSLQKTTWKGKVTSEATRGITQAKKIEAGLIERMTAIQAADDAAYNELLAKQNGQRLNFGYLLGILAAVADLFLLGLLFTAKRLRYEVAAINYQAKASSSTRSQYLTGRDAIAANPPTYNQVEKERRPIGFYRHDKPYNDESYTAEAEANDDAHDEPYNDKSYNDESYTPEREVVTITEREVVELTDRVKSCAHCGEKFVYYSSKAKYCSDECRARAWEVRTGKKWNFKPQKH